MKIEKISKKKNNLYQILLSDNTSLSFYDETIIHYNLLTFKEFDQSKLQEIIKYNNEISAYYQALNYIKTKLRTKKEIESKLIKAGYTKETIHNVIAKLEKQKYIDEKMYIKSYIADQVNLTLNGPKKIMYALNKLGFSKELVTTYLNEYENAIWQDKIKKIITKKININHTLSANYLVKKITNDLHILGYSQEQINAQMNNFTFEDDKNIIQKEILKAQKKYSKKYEGSELERQIKRYLYSKGFNDIDNYL